jgi:hypothetical protein
MVLRTLGYERSELVRNGLQRLGCAASDSNGPPRTSVRERRVVLAVRCDPGRRRARRPRRAGSVPARGWRGLVRPHLRRHDRRDPSQPTTAGADRRAKDRRPRRPWVVGPAEAAPVRSSPEGKRKRRHARALRARATTLRDPERLGRAAPRGRRPTNNNRGFVPRGGPRGREPAVMQLTIEVAVLSDPYAARNAKKSGYLQSQIES